MGAGPAIAKWRAAAIVCALSLASAGCGAPDRETFDLSGARTGAARGTSLGRARYSVGEPLANQPVGSDRIVVRIGPQEIALLGGAQWADRLPRLVQTRLVAAFERAGLSAAPAGAVADRQLSTDIRRFEIDATRGVAVVEIAARLVNDKDGAALASRVFVGEAPAAATGGAQAAHALEAALDQAVRQIVGWARAR
jgi:cholesterol transport system auxiliary component